MSSILHIQTLIKRSTTGLRKLSALSALTSRTLMPTVEAKNAQLRSLTWINRLSLLCGFLTKSQRLFFRTKPIFFIPFVDQQIINDMVLNRNMSSITSHIRKLPNNHHLVNCTVHSTIGSCPGRFAFHCWRWGIRNDNERESDG